MPHPYQKKIDILYYIFDEYLQYTLQTVIYRTALGSPALVSTSCSWKNVMFYDDIKVYLGICYLVKNEMAMCLLQQKINKSQRESQC